MGSMSSENWLLKYDRSLITISNVERFTPVLRLLILRPDIGWVHVSTSEMNTRRLYRMISATLS